MSLAINPIFHDLSTGDKEVKHPALRSASEIRVAIVTGSTATLQFTINGSVVEEVLPLDGDTAARYFYPGVESLSVSGDGKIAISVYE